MKKIIYISLLMLISTSAWAVYIPGMPQALLADYDLKVAVSQGVNSLEKASIVVYAKESEVEVSSISLDLKGGAQETSINFEVTDEESDGCGSLILHGESSSDAEIVLIDHSARFCEDYKPYSWEIEINHDDYLLEMLGNPQPVISIF